MQLAILKYWDCQLLIAKGYSLRFELPDAPGSAGNSCCRHNRHKLRRYSPSLEAVAGRRRTNSRHTGSADVRPQLPDGQYGTSVRGQNEPGNALLECGDVPSRAHRSE